MKKIFILLILLVTTTMLKSQVLQLSLDTINANPGDSISIPISTQNFLNIGSMTLYIQFNNNVVHFGSVINWHDQLIEGIHLANSSGNMLAIVWADISGASIPDGKIGDIRFKYLGGTTSLSFMGTSEITDIWGVSVTPPPLYSNGLVKLKLSAAAAASPANICLGDSSQLNVVTAGGLGTSTISWTSDPPGFVSALVNPWVYPSLPTTYTALATDGNDTAYSSVFIDVYDFIPPDPAADFFPANNSNNLSIPVLFSWSPALFATHYDFYIWESGSAEPTTPLHANLTQLNLQITLGINYGKTYNWRVVSKNPCLQTPGEILTFSTRHLPDLKIQNVITPSTAYSGQNIIATFQVHNIGLGSTMSSAWTDQLYLSSDTTYEPGIDIFLGALPNLSSLNPDESYIQHMAFTLPQGISGYYYLIAKTDIHNNVTETSDNNNSGYNADTFLITLSPVPDLRVTKIIIPNSIFSGQPMGISWKTENKGTAATPGSSWYDRIYLTADTSLQPASAHIIGTIQHTGVLGVDSSYTVNTVVTIPDYILGRHFVYVVTDFYNDVYEHAMENNNSLKSDSITIFLTPPPDLEVTNVVVQDTASKNEIITLTYSVENVGGSAASGYWYDKIYISNSLNLNTATAIHIGTIVHHYGLAMEASYTQTFTVQIPESVNGGYYIFVFTDATYMVFEHTYEANNIFRTGVIQILPPDLETDTALIPPVLYSGITLDLPYTLINNGPGKLIDSWVDKVFVSKQDVFNVDSALLCGTIVLNTKFLEPSETFDTTAHITVPNGISGPYYIYFYNDYLNSISENSAETNNIYRSTLPVQINLSPWPDLIVDQISYSTDTLNAGLYMDVNYLTVNQGAGPAFTPPFTDFIYLSTNPFSPVNLTSVTQYTHTAIIPSGQADTVTLNLQIPSHLGEGFYYFWIKTDYHNSIYEHTAEGNNFTRGNPVYILPYPPVDLVSTILSMPVSANSGQVVSISYRIENQGIAMAPNFWWYDAVVLSEDTVFNPATDILLQNFGRSGWLYPGSSYEETHSVNLPNGIQGDFYLMGIADRYHMVADPDFTNNIGLLRDSGGNPLAIHIESTPPPDLVVTNLEVPDVVIAGQPFKVKMTVENQGTGNTIPSSWTDLISLSINFSSSGIVFHLFSTTHYGGILPGDSYIDSAMVYLPASYQGNFIVIAHADLNNQVYEYPGESNNVFTKAILVQQPPPADLSIANINAGPVIIIGSPNNFTVSYKVKNTGLFPANGTMKDLIYLSTDTIWEVTDYIAGSVVEYISIGSGLELARTFTGTVSSLAVGDYYVLIRTDVLNNIYEGNDTNNTGRTDITTHVDVPELPLNTIVTNTLTDYLPLYYRIEIPSLLAGEVLYVTLQADSIFGINEMYIKYGTSPTRTEFDYSYSNPSYGNQEIIIPFLQEGTYYLMVYGSTSSGSDQNIELYAKKLDFIILSAEENEGGNTGMVTVKLTGSKFENTMSVFLVKGESTIEGNLLLFIDQSSAYVTFNLEDADTGYYHVVANKFCGGMAILENGFHVVSGQSPNLVVNVYQPSAMANNGVSVLQVEFTNAGNTDLIAPDCEFISLKNAPVSFTYQGLSAGLTSLILHMREPNGPTDVLRPGMSGTIMVYIKATKALVFTLKLPNY